ncbi:Phage gp6-like head-tail connector protein [Pseudomonas asturiensis]|uniref:Phage gp6-like head-tail connector protein n=1 Tax=Pseudomonas asturiensis TaxID=1190415 RepID=A0A1M7IZT6_9PSED|nr:head-tail connector protein [Pseudomonas asturiensis]SHM46354.1 Phage gp6-like head-tail connector protein [Pseudomonas asturiensis]
MSVIDIEAAMLHCRAEEADRSDVQLKLEAAEESAMAYLNRSFYADTESMAAAVLDLSAGEDPMIINKAITSACLLILGNLYANREDSVVGVSVAELPQGSRSLLHPYRVSLGV